MSEPGVQPGEQSDPTVALSELRSALHRAHLRSLASSDQLAAAAAEDAAFSERLRRAAALPRSQRERLLKKADELLAARQRGSAAQLHLEQLCDEVREALARAHAQGALAELAARSESLAELEAVLREAEEEPAPREEPTPPPLPAARERPKLGRNEPCPCGSGKKHKRCCGPAIG